MKRKPIVVPRFIECPFTEPYGYVYIYTNKINGHKYIGKHQFSKPFMDLSYTGSGGPHWKNALNKYGWDGFHKEVLFWLDKKSDLNEAEHNAILNYWEIYFIDLLGTYDNPKDYNHTQGGDGFTSDMMSGENNPMYGKSGELNPMYGRRGEDAPWWGKRHTEETRKKISEANKGKVFSQETKDKISKANSGHKMSEEHKRINSETCKKRTGSNNPMWKGGKKIVNKEHSEFMKGKRMSPKTEFTSENSSGANNSQARAVVRLSPDGELLQTYGYLNEVCKDPQFPSAEGVRNCCKGRQTKYKGYIWMYKEDYEKTIGGGA